MTTMAESGVAQSPHDVLPPQSEDEDPYMALPEMERLDISTLKHQLFSQQLLTVEQLNEITVDADIQSSVDEFLKGLTQQMFARIVRSGSAEVGRWLGAKVQGERDGWTAMLRMAMAEIEFHRKNALQGQVVLHDTWDQLRLLTDCFALDEDTRRELHTEDVAQGITACVKTIAECLNSLMEDRFQCLDILGCGDPVPDSLSSAVTAFKDKVVELEEEKEELKKRLEVMEGEVTGLKGEKEETLKDVQNMEERVKSKQEDLETLMAQLKELERVVRCKRNNSVSKCVGTSPDLHKGKSKNKELTASKPSSKVAVSVGTLSSTARQHIYTQTQCEPSFIELSEEKLKVLKERARKLESSLHGAIASMGKLRKGGASNSTSKPSTSSSTAPATATLVPLPTDRHPDSTPKTWVSASFEVTNSTTASVTAPVPKLGHFPPSERRCLSERPAGKNSEELTVLEKARQTNLKLARTRLGQVSKCLRCQRLFTATDNHKLACVFHGRGKERLEVYSDGGQLVKVKYVWKCCHQRGDTDGCCYGHHV
ncbi:uncharacterized protein [Littorina saxatilis]|uniref:Uncharacterized protein n=1 Tax=Littorina saxatilis TaxID=31220 RepID=A0AAN9AQC8_9CAEN